MRYGWEPTNLPSHCACGEPFDSCHALTCNKGGFTIARHNEIRDLMASLLREVCTDVEVEPRLQPLSGEVLESRVEVVLDAGWSFLQMPRDCRVTFVQLQFRFWFTKDLGWKVLFDPFPELLESSADIRALTVTRKVINDIALHSCRQSIFYNSGKAFRVVKNVLSCTLRNDSWTVRSISRRKPPLALPFQGRVRVTVLGLVALDSSSSDSGGLAGGVCLNLSIVLLVSCFTIRKG